MAAKKKVTVEMDEGTLHKLHDAVSHNEKLASAINMSATDSADRERLQQRAAKKKKAAAKKSAKKGAKKSAKKKSR